MTSLVLDEAQALINDRFIAQWASRTPFIFDNEKSLTNLVDDPWVRVTSKLADSNQHTLGRKGCRKYERRGLIFVQVFAPVLNGTKTATDLAQVAQDIFEGETFNGVMCFDSMIKNAGIDGPWFHMQVLIEFLFDETK